MPIWCEGGRDKKLDTFCWICYNPLVCYFRFGDMMVNKVLIGCRAEVLTSPSSLDFLSNLKHNYDQKWGRENPVEELNKIGGPLFGCFVGRFAKDWTSSGFHDMQPP